MKSSLQYACTPSRPMTHPVATSITGFMSALATDKSPVVTMTKAGAWNGKLLGVWVI